MHWWGKANTHKAKLFSSDAETPCFSSCCAWHWLLCCISFHSSCSERDDWYSCISRHIPDDYTAHNTSTFHSSVEVKAGQVFQCSKREGGRERRREREEKRRNIKCRVPSGKTSSIFIETSMPSLNNGAHHSSQASSEVLITLHTPWSLLI